MRVSLSRTLDGTKGLQKFGSLLIEELRNNFGVEVVDKDTSSDIHLTIISGTVKKGSKNVLRLDGVYYDVGRIKSNHPIRKNICDMDGVIYQSAWCQVFVETMLSVRAKQSVIIHNGSSQQLLRQAKPYKHTYDKVFVCCADWRPNKRLRSIVHSFIRLANENANIGLFVMGKPDYFFRHPCIKYFSVVGSETLFSVYKSADYMCHICHIDACPNSVVETLLSGLPVLCNNIGGTPELVGGDGIILPLDKPFDFKPIRNMEVVGPDSVDGNILYRGMSDMMSREWKVDRPDLDISQSTKKYYEFFEKLLSNE